MQFFANYFRTGGEAELNQSWNYLPCIPHTSSLTGDFANDLAAQCQSLPKFGLCPPSPHVWAVPVQTQLFFNIDHNNKQGFSNLLWEFICYSPQWPVRHHQQQLLDDGEKFNLKVYDEHFSKKELNVNGFKWGNGKHKVLLTHGWGSKEVDFLNLSMP